METVRSCPICKRAIAKGSDANRYRPFCSRRCADIDLGRWLKGSYAIPAEEPPGESESDNGEGGAADAEAVPRR